VVANWLVDHPHIHIATAGPGTADALSVELKQRIAYCGNGEPQGAMDTFLKDRTEGEAVGLPHSEVSLRRWENANTLAELHPWVAYSVKPNKGIPPDGDVVFFTSPSNVRAWTGPRPERIVALGTTTSEALTERRWAHRVAEHPDAFGVWEALQER
jgi:uroporphyrinogen-III synthase